MVTTRGAARSVTTLHPAARLVPDTAPPKSSVRLLWFDGRVAQPSGSGALVVDAAGGILSVDTRLRFTRVPAKVDEREILSAAAGPDGRIWATDANGDVLRVSTTGAVDVEERTPFTYPAVAGDGRGPLWLVRSPQYFSYNWDSAGGALLLRADGTGGRFVAVGRAQLPAHVFLQDLANAGTVVPAGDTVYYAPFIRDDIVALTPAGDTLWIAHRGLPQSTVEPRFEVLHGSVVADYHPVNLGAVLGPDARLYVLSTPGFTMMESRLDVFDRRTGVLLRTVPLPTASPTLAGDSTGRIYLLDQMRLLTGLAPEEREPFRPFDLPRLGGGRQTLDQLAGKVVFINFWASWCTPCRTELPTLDRLRHGVTDSGFVFLTIDEDADTADARTFVRRLGLTFPVLLGEGREREVYHYPGLPYSVLLDRKGNVAARWIGPIDEDGIGLLRTTIATELGRRDGSMTHGGSMASMH